MNIESLSPIYNTNKDSNIYKLLSIFAKQKKELDEQIEIVNFIYNITLQEGKNLDALGENLIFKRGGMSDNEYKQVLLIASGLRSGDVSVEGINSTMKSIFKEKYVGCWDYVLGDNNASQFFDGSRYFFGDWFLSGEKTEPNFFEIVVKNMNETELAFFENILKIIKAAGIKYYILNLKE